MKLFYCNNCHKLVYWNSYNYSLFGIEDCDIPCCVYCKSKEISPCVLKGWEIKDEVKDDD